MTIRAFISMTSVNATGLDAKPPNTHCGAVDAGLASKPFPRSRRAELSCSSALPRLPARHRHELQKPRPSPVHDVCCIVPSHSPTLSYRTQNRMFDGVHVCVSQCTRLRGAGSLDGTPPERPTCSQPSERICRPGAPTAALTRSLSLSLSAFCSAASATETRMRARAHGARPPLVPHHSLSALRFTSDPLSALCLGSLLNLDSVHVFRCVVTWVTDMFCRHRPSGSVRGGRTRPFTAEWHNMCASRHDEAPE